MFIQGGAARSMQTKVHAAVRLEITRSGAGRRPCQKGRISAPLSCETGNGADTTLSESLPKQDSLAKRQASPRAPALWSQQPQANSRSRSLFDTEKATTYTMKTACRQAKREVLSRFCIVDAAMVRCHRQNAHFRMRSAYYDPALTLAPLLFAP